MKTISHDDFSLTEAVLNKVAEIYFSSQVNELESLEIDINSKPEKLIKGEVDSIDLKGKDLVIFQNISIKEINIKLDNMVLDVFETISGTVKLEKPSNIDAKLILSTADCDRLLNSKYLNTLLKRLPIEINDRLFIFEIRHAKCDLKNNNKVTLSAELILTQLEKTTPSSSEERKTSVIETNTSKFEIELFVEEGGKKILFEGGKYQKKQALSLEATIAIISKIRDLIYFRHFTSPNLSFDINTIEINTNQLILRVSATVSKLPNSLESPIETAALEIN